MNAVVSAVKASERAKQITSHIEDVRVRSRTEDFLREVLLSLDAISDVDDEPAVENSYINDNYDHVPVRTVDDIEHSQKQKIGQLLEDNILLEEVEEDEEENPLNLRGKFGYTQLHNAVVEENADEVISLLSRGADRYIKDNGGNTPYDKAMKLGLYEIAKLLD